uniref:F-box only protein n=1 Tax=Myotis myotis TaxID=51298 RepID=A0A7J7U4Y9_MYOMY|nr:F-box protein 48 [Myotis myotis]
MNQNNFFMWLPQEVTLYIFSQLDIQSLCRASMTCMSWFATIRNNDRLWKPHCLAVRAVCRREVDDDRKSGYSWRVSIIFVVCSILKYTVVGVNQTLLSAWMR